MILLITNSSDVTTDFVVKKLSDREVPFYRFNTDRLFDSVNVDFNFQKDQFFIYDQKANTRIDLNEIKSVYFRRPELPDFKSIDLPPGDMRFIKNEVLFCLEGIYKLLENAFWINPVYKIREAENKIYQLQLARKLGFSIPNSIVSNVHASVSAFFAENDNSCITKPLKTGLIEDTPSKVIFTSEVNPASLEEERIRLFPNFFQNCIRKIADIRVTVVQDKAFPARIETTHNDFMVDWRSVDPNFLKYSEITLPKDIENKCLALTKELGLRFSAIDFVMDAENAFHFLEINPNGQWGWIEKRLNNGISDAIVNLLENETD